MRSPAEHGAGAERSREQHLDTATAAVAAVAAVAVVAVGRHEVKIVEAQMA